MKLPFKKGKEVVFQKVKSQKGFTLENQDGKLTDFGDVDIEDYLDDMFHTPDQFVILTAPKPQNKVRYVQACTHDGEVEVELGIEEEGTRLHAGLLCNSSKKIPISFEKNKSYEQIR